jgi:hypothetical protein
MTAQTGRPDAGPPGFGGLFYFAFCWGLRHPRLLRLVGAVLRKTPRLSVIPARRSAVKNVLTRTRSFSNTSHEANLVAGDFLIGMDPGPTYAQDRALFETFLAMLKPAADADAEARRRVERLAAEEAPDSFDLVEDYLLWVVFAALKPAFGFAADDLVAASRDFIPDEATERHYLHEVRYVAAQLLGGNLAPTPVRRRAELSAASLRARIEAMTPELAMAWPQTSAMPYSVIRRNAIGLAWVSHPVTVQSAALVVQELLARPDTYDTLRTQAQALKDAVWRDGDFRKTVRAHVLELMRFRPVFPALARDVPRATEFDSGAHTNPKCPAGSSLTILSISALFDPLPGDDLGGYCPHRDWGKDEDARFLMFGFGERQCPAKDHALQILTSAVIGLLRLPKLQYADGWCKRIHYDGPMIDRMRLRPVRS